MFVFSASGTLLWDCIRKNKSEPNALGVRLTIVFGGIGMIRAALS